MLDLRNVRTYVQDVLGVKSFLALENQNKNDYPQSYLIEGSANPRVLFLRQKTEVSVLSGELSDLYKKILQSLKRPNHDLATIEWSNTNEVLDNILKLRPRIIIALGMGAENFVDVNSVQLKPFTVIKSKDPQHVAQNEDLKRALWNDLKTVIRLLELS